MFKKKQNYFERYYYCISDLLALQSTDGNPKS